MVNKPSNAQRNLAVSFTTCAPQLLAHLHPSHLCSCSQHPTTHPTTCAPQPAPQLLAHLHPGHLCSSVPPPHHTPNYLCTKASRPPMQHLFRLPNPQVVHKHVSWGILCTFIAATHEATTPTTSFLYDQIFCMWLCSAGPTILLDTPLCTVQPLLCLFVDHRLAVFVISVWLDTFIMPDIHFCSYVNVFEVFCIRNICIVLRHLPLIVSNINSTSGRLETKVKIEPPTAKQLLF